MRYRREVTINHLFRKLKHGFAILSRLKGLFSSQMHKLLAAILGVGIGVAGLYVSLWDGKIISVPFIFEQNDALETVYTVAGLQNLGNNCFLNVILQAAFLMPFTTISLKIYCEDFLPLYPASSSPSFSSLDAPTSISFYKEDLHTTSNSYMSPHSLLDYICFRVSEKSLDMNNCIGIFRGFTDSSSIQKGLTSLEAAFLSIPEEYHCVDLSLYKDTQIVLLLNEASSLSESPGRSWMMMIQASDLCFTSVSRPALENLWTLHEMKAFATELNFDNGKVRCIPHAASAPLAVSASRGVACVFSSRRHALVYILDEDEEEASDDTSGSE